MAISSTSFLTKGSQVEVSSHKPGSNDGAWYTATVIYPPPSSHTTRNSLVYVEYHNLLSEAGSSNRLREYANVAYVRPAPAHDTGPVSFQVNDLVDAFYRDGWWTGVVTGVVDAENYVVSFENPPGEVRFRCEELRMHKEWISGRWIERKKQETTGWMFTVGKKVEVSFEKERLRDVWFPATVLKNSGNSTFLVEYQPGAGNEAIIHTTVDCHHIRPSPPYLKDKNFGVSEKVDVYYDFGWWCGVITEVLPDNRYNVFFKHTKNAREFIYSKVRPHMEWKGGKWFNTSQDDTALRTTDTQIEQATPVTGKESPVATSVMKRKIQDLDSNDKASPGDDVMKVDSSKKKKHQSDGQSKGVDSEVSGTTDQAASKTEDLSHGKKVGGTAVRTTHSLIGKQPQPLNPTIILKRHKTSPNDEIMNADSSKKKMPPSDGQSEGFDSEVNGMTDQASSETENLSHEKKAGDTAVGTTDSLIDNQIEQTTPTIGKQPPVATSIVKGKTQKNVDSNGETSPSDEIVNADSSTKKKQLSGGQSENLDSEVSEMTDQEKRERNTEMKASTKGSKRKKGGLSKELKSLQASTKGSEIDLLRTRTQELVGKKDATKNLPPILDLQCNAMTVSEGKIVQKPLGEKTSNVAETDTNQPDGPLAPSTVVDQEGSEGDAASVALKRKTKKNSSRKGKRVKRRAISDINTELPAQVSAVSEDASKEKADGSLEKDSTTNPEASFGKSLDTVPVDQPILRRGEGKHSPVTISNQHASKEKADGSLEKDSTTNPEASVGKSLDTVPVDQPILRRCEGNHSPVTTSNQQLNLSVEATAEESTSRASVGLLDLGNLPFIKSMALWKTPESMEAFRKLPQKPHFRPLLDGVKEGAREGLAIAAMVNFATTFDQAYSLKFDDPRRVIEDRLETLAELEDNGFAVEVLRQRLTTLLSMKDKHEKFVERSKGIAEELEERNIQDKITEEEIEKMNRQIRELEEIKTLKLVKKEKIISELGAMEETKQVIKEIGAEFDKLTKAPFV
ncbi:uncharacterized protein LOC143549111 [Bidens hawaiensis]|uniref:uncharacterized protein LOC143549111 n=1 Tax=Bidens hawaiensis TaxID=980011 RepID=UPI00404A5D7D